MAESRIVRKVCKACGNEYWEAVDAPFVTCKSCRHPVLEDGGGCHYWQSAGYHRATTAQMLSENPFGIQRVLS